MRLNVEISSATLYGNVVAVRITVVGVLVSIEFDRKAVLDGSSRTAGGGNVVVTIRNVLTIPGVADCARTCGIILDDQLQTVGRKTAVEAGVGVGDLELKRRGGPSRERLLDREPR